MARGLNKVMIIGNLGADPEVRTTQGGAKVANLRVATSEQWTDKSGQKQESTEWHKIVFFGTQAEIAEKYLKKGGKIYVEGSLQTQKWQDKDGNDRYTTEIRGRSFLMLDSRGGEGGGYEGGSSGRDYGGPSSSDIGDDDIPF